MRLSELLEKHCYDWVAKDANGEVYIYMYEPYFDKEDGTWKCDNLDSNECIHIGLDIDLGFISNDTEKQIKNRLDLDRYKHKKSGKELSVVKIKGIVGRFEVVDSEEKQRYLRFGKRRIVCLMSEVEKLD